MSSDRLVRLQEEVSGRSVSFGKDHRKALQAIEERLEEGVHRNAALGNARATNSVLSQTSGKTAREEVRAASPAQLMLTFCSYRCLTCHWLQVEQIVAFLTKPKEMRSTQELGTVVAWFSANVIDR